MEKKILRQLKEDMALLANVELFVKETLREGLDVELLELDLSILKNRSKNAIESLEDLINYAKEKGQTK